MNRLLFWVVLLLPTSFDVAIGAPLCGSHVVRNLEFSGRECSGICRVLRKRVTFIGDKILFGEPSVQSGAVFLLNADTDLQNDPFNIPNQPGQSFPNTRSVGKATSTVRLPNISLSIHRQLLSSSNQVVADYQENLVIRLNERCDECLVSEYRFSFTTPERNGSSVFHPYSCRVSVE